MINIQLHNDCPATDTIVPNQFIDRFMPEANGEFVKVYLYLLRCIHSHASNCTISEIADKFNNTEMDVQRALRYWQKAGLLALDETADKKLCGISLLPFPEDTADMTEQSSTRSASSTKEAPVSVEEPSADIRPAEPAAVAAPAPAPEKEVPQIRQYTLDEVAEFQKNPDIQEMLFVVETYIRHPFGENDINTILFWHEELHFSTELIVYLVEYCVSKGHTNLRYLNKVALAWHEKNITSVTQAKEEAAIRSKAYYTVMKAFGITGRNLIESETAFIRKWTKEYAFDLSIIQEACSRTIAGTGQSSFSYADSILTSWYNDKVHTLEDIKRLDATHQQKKKEKAAARTAAAASGKKNNFNNFEDRDNDYQSLEAMLLNSPIRS